MTHQLPALEAARGKPAFAFFLDMRLGKTMVAIEHVKQFNPRRWLVTCPGEAAASWFRDLAVHGLPASDVCARGRSAKPADEGATVCNFETFRLSADLQSHPWDAVVVDESQRIANPRATTTKAVLKRLAGAPVRVLLSGEPFPERTFQLVTQAIFLFGHALGCRTAWEFRARRMHKAGFDWAFNKGQEAALIAQMAAGSFVMSSARAGVDTPVSRSRRFVTLPPRCLAAIERLRESWEWSGRGGAVTWLTNALEVMTIEQRMADGVHPSCPHQAKAAQVARLASLDGRRVVAWFKHNDLLAMVARRLRRDGVDFAEVTGRTKDRRRRLQWFAWGERGPKVLLAQIAACGVGCDLAEADLELFASHHPSRGLRGQAEARCKHPRKAAAGRSVEVVDLVGAGSVDELLCESLDEKRLRSRSGLAAMAAAYKRMVTSIRR